MTQYKTIVIDCDGIIINHYQGILTKIYELQQNLPQDNAYQESLIRFYLNHYYQLSDSLPQNGFCASHCFTFQALMQMLKITPSWKKTIRFGRAVKEWPLYEDAYGALHYLKKFFRVLIRCDREPEDIPGLLAALDITEKELFIRHDEDQDLNTVLVSRDSHIEDTLLLTTPHLARLTAFPNIRVIQRNTKNLPDKQKTESLANLVIEHQNILRS